MCTCNVCLMICQYFHDFCIFFGQYYVSMYVYTSYNCTSLLNDDEVNVNFSYLSNYSPQTLIIIVLHHL